MRGRSKPGGEQRCAAPVVKLLRERQVLSPEAMPNVAPIFRLLRPRTARRPRPGAVAPSLGLQRPHFCRRNAGWERRVITPLESAGSAEMAHIGDFSDSSGTYATPQAALCASRQAQPRRRRSARAQVPAPRPYCTRRLSGGRGDGVEVDAIDATRWEQKITGNYLTPGDPIFVDVALPRASFSFDVDFWWSFVWSFTPCKIVTIFVSSTIPAITISSRM